MILWTTTYRTRLKHPQYHLTMVQAASILNLWSLWNRVRILDPGMICAGRAQLFAGGDVVPAMFLDKVAFPPSCAVRAHLWGLTPPPSPPQLLLLSFPSTHPWWNCRHIHCRDRLLLHTLGWSSSRRTLQHHPSPNQSATFGARIFWLSSTWDNFTYDNYDDDDNIDVDDDDNGLLARLDVPP